MHWAKFYMLYSLENKSIEDSAIGVLNDSNTDFLKHIFSRVCRYGELIVDLRISGRFVSLLQDKALRWIYFITRVYKKNINFYLTIKQGEVY